MDLARLFNPEITSAIVLEFTILDKINDATLKSICDNVHHNVDPDKGVISLKCTKLWRGDHYAPISPLATPDDGIMEIVPAVAIPVDRTGQHFIVIGNIYTAYEMKHGPIVIDRDGHASEFESPERGDVFLALVDIASRRGAFQAFGGNCKSYIELMPSEFINFDCGITTPRLFIEAVNIDELLRNSAQPDPDPIPNPQPNPDSIPDPQPEPAPEPQPEPQPAPKPQPGPSYGPVPPVDEVDDEEE